MVATRDIPNVARYGWNSPRWAEAITVDPGSIRRISRQFSGDATSGAVRGGDWPDLAYSLTTDEKYAGCWAHWNDGVPWADTGIHEYILERIAEAGSFDGCVSVEDINSRYARLDEIYREVQSSSRIQAHRERTRFAFRGLGDIRVHLAEDEVIFGGAGVHRLAMAKVLCLPRVPARIGVVHPTALPNLARYRKARRSGDPDA